MVAAAADSYGGTSAADTVNQLTSDGYNVELNLDGARDVPVSECTVTGTHGIPKTAPPGRTGGPGGSSSPCPSTSTARQTTELRWPARSAAETVDGQIFSVEYDGIEYGGLPVC